MTRFRDFGVTVGSLPTGERNMITDVRGVNVGHTTRNEGDNIRTGVTAILPHGSNIFQQKVPAVVHTINGFGKAAGFEQVRELGTIETPIALTNTMCVGKVSDALISYTINHNPTVWSVNTLVAECNDSYLNDIQARVITEADVFNAINSASADVVEGCVGAATGTSCYGFKGGIGTASRVTGKGYTVGALLQTNFGAMHELTMLGVPIGQHIVGGMNASTDGSVVIVLATDAPLTSRQLGRLAHRAAFGLARTGTICHHGSGDFVITFSTAYQLQTDSQELTRLPDTGQVFNELFDAVGESVEESVYNALVKAETTIGRDGNMLKAIPHDAIVRWLTHYKRL